MPTTSKLLFGQFVRSSFFFSTVKQGLSLTCVVGHC